MSTITKERVTGIARGEKCYTHDDVVELARIALASLEAEKNAEPVAKVETVGVCWYADNGVPRKPAVGTELYTVQPAPVALPVQHWEELCRQNPDMSIGDAIIRAAWWNHCAAMLQGGKS